MTTTPTRLAGRAVLVTGASSGIGRAIALRLASEGAAILCCDVTEEPRAHGLDEAPGIATASVIVERGGEARFWECNAADEQAVDAAFKEAERLSVPLRSCVLNAGVFSRDVSILEESVDEHDWVMRVNERSVWLGCRAAARRFVARSAGGRIICIGSISGLVGLADEPAYCASKGAVVNLVRAVALDLAPHRINVNAVCPGFVATAMLSESLEDADRRARLEALTPWPRLGRPSDVAAAVAFLVSDDAEWITGVALPVDGGYTCR